MECSEEYDEDGYCMKCGAKYHCLVCNQPVANMYATGHVCRKPRYQEPSIWVHGCRARDLKQVESYLSGDAHDQSKVQWYDGNQFHDLVIGE